MIIKKTTARRWSRHIDRTFPLAAGLFLTFVVANELPLEDGSLVYLATVVIGICLMSTGVIDWLKYVDRYHSDRIPRFIQRHPTEDS